MKEKCFEIVRSEEVTVGHTRKIVNNDDLLLADKIKEDRNINLNKSDQQTQAGEKEIGNESFFEVLKRSVIENLNLSILISVIVIYFAFVLWSVNEVEKIDCLKLCGSQNSSNCSEVKLENNQSLSASEAKEDIQKESLKVIEKNNFSSDQKCQNFNANPSFAKEWVKENIEVNENICRACQSKNEDLVLQLNRSMCEEFDRADDLKKKLAFLLEHLLWEPRYKNAYIQLRNLISFKNCRYFIGVSNKALYMFSIFQDFTKKIDVNYFDWSYLISPDKNYISIMSKRGTLSLLDIRRFLLTEVYSDYTIFQRSHLASFSPDSKYLFYYLQNTIDIKVFKLDQNSLVYSFNIDPKFTPLRNIKASKNLYHLIVKDVNNRILVFSLYSKNYIYLLDDYASKVRHEETFPEVFM